MKTTVEIDIEEALDNLSNRERSAILSSYLNDIQDDDDLIEVLKSRGYVVTEKD